ATLTTEPSMKAMLEPKMVASSTQTPALSVGERSAAWGAQRMTASSQGGFTSWVIERIFRRFLAQVYSFSRRAETWLPSSEYSTRIKMGWQQTWQSSTYSTASSEGSGSTQRTST